MSKRMRQYLGIITAIAIYYLIHEGAHLIYALFLGVFKQVRFLGLGVQIVAATERLNSTQLGLFCLVGPVAALLAGYGLLTATGKICAAQSKVFRACMYYATIALLFCDPLYLSVLYGFFGGGDMNGIALLIPERIARLIFGVLFLINAFAFWELALPKYRKEFSA